VKRWQELRKAVRPIAPGFSPLKFGPARQASAPIQLQSLTQNQKKSSHFFGAKNVTSQLVAAVNPEWKDLSVGRV